MDSPRLNIGSNTNQTSTNTPTVSSSEITQIDICHLVEKNKKEQLIQILALRRMLLFTEVQNMLEYQTIVSKYSGLPDKSNRNRGQWTCNTWENEWQYY